MRIFQRNLRTSAENIWNISAKFHKIFPKKPGPLTAPVVIIRKVQSECPRREDDGGPWEPTPHIGTTSHVPRLFQSMHKPQALSRVVVKCDTTSF